MNLFELFINLFIHKLINYKLFYEFAFYEWKKEWMNSVFLFELIYLVINEFIFFINKWIN